MFAFVLDYTLAKIIMGPSLLKNHLCIWVQFVHLDIQMVLNHHIDGLVQERRNSSALAMELRLSCTNPSICAVVVIDVDFNWKTLKWMNNPQS